ncbi:TIGR03943 family putative permease subunit [Nocardia anaemiae]|uniref:TIGR03943 family putative permease subunit n=1 Tax=Nocardia anaemiae TaxID=263910 RepID=UPI0007A4C689|nr:TIGR03943 family protein [Nocardia anaemiae]
MRREAQNLLLLLIGSAVLWITLDGSYLRYVKPSLYPFLLISSIGFILLALIAIIRDIRRGTASDDHVDMHGHSEVLSHIDTRRPNNMLGGDDAPGHRAFDASEIGGVAATFGRDDALSHADARGHEDAGGHGEHDHGSGRAQWLLLAPVAALLLIAPPALGAGAAVTSSPVQVVPRDIAAEQPKLWAFPPLPAEPAPRLPIVDLVDRALQDSSHSLDGREVTISGFIIRPKDLEQQHPDTPDADLARVVITCCVADARYVLVHLSGMSEVIEDDAWLEVRGVVESGSAQRDPGHTPTIVVTDYQRIEAPDRPYERGR